SRLDDVVDYFTYVLVPAFFLLQMNLLPAGGALPGVPLMAIASGYGFSQTAANTPDPFFTAFPAHRNVDPFHPSALGWPPAVTAAWLIAFAVGVFVPVRYVYPSRTPTMRALTVTLGIAWGAVLVHVVLHLGTAPRGLVVASLAFPIYYFALSLALHF